MGEGQCVLECQNDQQCRNQGWSKCSKSAFKLGMGSGECEGRNNNQTVNTQGVHTQGVNTNRNGVYQNNVVRRTTNGKVTCKRDLDCTSQGWSKCSKSGWKLGMGEGQCVQVCQNDQQCRNQGWSKCSKGIFSKNGECARLVEESTNLELKEIIEDMEKGDENSFSGYLMVFLVAALLGAFIYTVLKKRDAMRLSKIDQADIERSRLVAANE